MAKGDDTKSQNSQVDAERSLRNQTNFDVQNLSLQCVRGEGERIARALERDVEGTEITGGELCQTVFDELNDRIEAGERLYEGREDSPPLTAPQVPQAAGRVEATTQGILTSSNAGAENYYASYMFGRTDSLPEGIDIPYGGPRSEAVRSACVGNRVSGVALDRQYYDLAEGNSTPVENCVVIGYNDGLEDSGISQLTSADPDTIDGPNATPSTGGRGGNSIGGRQ